MAVITLKNELTGLTEMIDQYNSMLNEENRTVFSVKAKLLSGLKEVCAKAREAWALAIFTNASEESLGRYFSHHVKVLTVCLGSLPCHPKNAVLAKPYVIQEDQPETAGQQLGELLYHTCRFYGKYIDAALFVPLILQS